MIQYLTWFLCILFLIGAISNGFAPEKIRDSYARWGYPEWFPYVTAGLELAVAIMLFFPATRLLGAGLGMMIMVAAAATLLRHREYATALSPIVVFVLTGFIGWTSISGL